MIENLEEINLDLTPLTKQLLINYISIMYEENAEYSDESLRQELLYLEQTNNIGQLFIAESMSNYFASQQGS